MHSAQRQQPVRLPCVHHAFTIPGCTACWCSRARVCTASRRGAVSPVTAFTSCPRCTRSRRIWGSTQVGSMPPERTHRLSRERPSVDLHCRAVHKMRRRRPVLNAVLVRQNTTVTHYTVTACTALMHSTIQSNAKTTHCAVADTPCSSI